MTNQAILLEHEKTPLLVEYLIKNNLVLSQPTSTMRGIIIWAETFSLKEISIEVQEKKIIDGYKSCPICNTLTDQFVVDYRKRDDCLSKILVCWDCSMETDTNYYRLKSLNKKEKLFFLKQQFKMNDL